MPEKVMGLGQLKSLKKVLENAEGEFLKYEGAPRIINGRSGRIAFVAERDGYEGEFERFEVRNAGGSEDGRACCLRDVRRARWSRHHSVGGPGPES